MHVLITGFAGSLGSEFTKFCLERGDIVTGVDNNEWAVASFPDHEHLTKRLRDFDQITGSFDFIIHCAAYKHVDLIESNTSSANHNNVVRTESLYKQVTGPVLFISTDKAVDPKSFYGMTKEVGEHLTHDRGDVVARLGNILGSSGSVIPRWEQAILDGKPLPVTDLLMGRYMIPADEAVKKIMALLPFASPGTTIIPEMGEEVPLSELVATVLKLHSKPADYPVEIIGMRPGEKLHEKLTWNDEEVIYSDLNGVIVRR